MEQSRGNTGRPNHPPPYLVLTIIGAIAIVVIVAIFSTPLISAVIGIVAGVIAIVVLYMAAKEVSAHVESVILETENTQKDMASVLSEISQVRNEIQSNNWYARGDISKIEGNSKIAISEVNQIIDTIFGYLYEIPCIFSVYDEHGRFIYVNKLTEGMGYTKEFAIGKTLHEATPSDTTTKVTEMTKDVVRTASKHQKQEITISPKGEELVEEFFFSPVLNADGKAVAAMLVNFDLTSNLEKGKKINAYQDFEARDITVKLRDGLAKGLLRFSFTPEPYDEDTARAAAAYKQIGETLEYAITFIKGYVEEISQLLQEFSDENFDVTIKQNYMGDFGTIKDSMQRLINSIGILVSEIQSSTSQVEVGAEQISQSTQELMANFEEQAASMSEVRSAVDVLTEKTQKNASDLKSAGELSEEVQNAAKDGAAHMKEMTATMEEIKLSSTEIANVASIIEGIAFQTNLLALNASVEAARAGEHGKGFAVVADEVRSLAGRSADAARDTAEMISKSLLSVDGGVAKSLQTAEALYTILEMMNNATEVINGIAMVSEEQAEEIGRIQNSMESIYAATSNNASAVQSNASVSEELSSQASMLMSLVERFKIGRRM